MLSFGAPLEVTALSDGAGASRAYGSIVAGFSTGHASTRFTGGQDCVQVYLSPLGVGRVMGVPGSEVANQMVALGDVELALGAALAERLGLARTWEERFAVVGRALLRRAADQPAAAVFSTHVGLTPKQAASVVRFERAAADLHRLPLTQIAAQHGYSDQGHFTRASLRHAGETPGQLAAARRPTPLTALGRHREA